MAVLLGENNQTIVDVQKGYSDIATNRALPQYVDKFIEINKDFAPLFTILERTGRIKEVSGPSYFHFEDDDLPQMVEVDGSHAAGATTIALTTNHGKRIKAGDTLFVPRTGEQLYVSSKTDSSCVVVRSTGDVAAATINDDEDLQILASTMGDGSSAPDGVHSEPVRKLNYMQICRESIDMTGRALESGVYGPDEWTRAKSLALRSLMMKQEKTLLWNDLNDGTSGSPAQTGGLNYWLSTNVTDAGGTLDEATLSTHIKKIMRRNAGSNSVINIAGELVCDALDRIGRDNIRYDANDKVAGIAIGRYQTSHGNLKLLKHAMFTDAFDASSTWSGTMFNINMDKFKKVAWKGRHMQYMKKMETPGDDAKKEGWLDDFGAWFASELHHGKLDGVTG